MAEPKWELADYAPMIAKLNEVAAELAQIAASAVAGCPCAACDPGLILDGERLPFASRMNVCPDCGNKRCPKAANHALWQCSGSNAVGQVGVRTEEARIAAPVPAVGPGSGSGDSRTLGDRLRALAAGPHPDVLLVKTSEGEWLSICAEADRMDGKRARQAQTIGELQEVRERLAMVRNLARGIREHAHCKHLAGDIETVLDTPIDELREA